MITAPDKSRILTVFKYCQRAFRDAGINLVFPKNVDPAKTYKWRYLESFCERMDEHNIPDNVAVKLIRAIVQFSKEHGMLKTRGIAILSSSKLFEVGLKAIDNEEKDNNSIIAQIKTGHNTLNGHADKVKILLTKETSKSLPNIVRWNMQQKLPLLYIAVSKSCGEAMRALNEVERSIILPNDYRLIEARDNCCRDVITKYKIRLMLGDDWGVAC